MNQLISIVVPVYNTGKYLEDSLSSISNQTYRNFEAILVDDGSTDNSAAICDEFAQRDQRFVVIHQQNSGISNARNKGLSCIHGDYIIFVDSDDIILNDYVEKLAANIGTSDMIVCGSYNINEDGSLLGENACGNFSYSGNETIKQAYIEEKIGNVYTPWGKLYHMQNVGGELRFDEKLKVAEDIVFNLEFLRTAVSVKGINYAGYGIRQHRNSTTHQIALKYTPLYEHGYTIIRDAQEAAKQRWGIDATVLEAERIRADATRYFHEVCNLFAQGTPYSIKGKYLAIRSIHKDVSFMNSIRANKSMNGLSVTGKIGVICAGVKCTAFSYLLFKLISFYRYITHK